jgi:hypothetical protein
MSAPPRLPIAFHLVQGAVIGAVIGLVIPGDFILRVACTAGVGLVVGVLVSVGRRGL